MMKKWKKNKISKKVKVKKAYGRKKKKKKGKRFKTEKQFIKNLISDIFFYISEKFVSL